MNEHPSGSPRIWQALFKRPIDVVAAACGLVVLSPLFAVIAVAIRLDSRGPVFFLQERLGRGFRPFRIIKFRTMVRDAPKRGGPLTAGNDDPRITRVGRFLRRTKLDELPQLLNVLKGDMSLVGPRPEAPRFVEMFRTDYAHLLSVRPGLTDFASLAYRDEGALLSGVPDAEKAYVEWILPDKISLSRKYIAEMSFCLDLRLILGTIFGAPAQGSRRGSSLRGPETG